MSIKQNKNKDLCFTLKTSVMASCLLASLPVNMANAQDNSASADDQQIQEVVVEIGILGSILRSLREKRNADQIKDVISAEDIGKLPDQNLAEALQRITGVQISRDFGDGSEVSIRGMAQNRVEINGQSVMGSNSEGRGISFNDLAPDAFSSIEVIKTPMAKMTEGSLGGTIRLNTRRAFNSRGTVLSGRIQGEYVEDLDGEWDHGDDITPTVSLFGSTRWDTDFGEMGVTASFTYQEQNRTKDTSEMRWKPYSVTGTQRTVTAANGDSLASAGDTIFAPQQIKFQAWDREQTRTGLVSGFQWQVTDTFQFYADANYNAFDISTASNSVQATFNSGQTNYTNAVMTDNNTLLQADVNTTFGNTNGWAQDSDRKTYGLTLGAEYLLDEWTITSTLGASHGETDQKNSFFSTPILSSRAVSYALINTDVPVLNFTTQAGAPIDTGSISTYKLNSLGLQDAFLETNNAEFKVDFNYNFDGEHLASIDFGARAANREASRVRDITSNISLRGQAVEDFPTLVDRMTPFPTDFLNGFSGGSYDYLAPQNGDFWSNPEIAIDVYGIDVATDLVPELGYQYNVEEETQAAYIQANFAGELLYIPYSGNIGFRRIFTDVISSGWLQPPGGIAATELAMTNEYGDTLGSANIGFAVFDDLLVRFSIADVMSRPRISDLSAATKINTGDATGRSGNVLLEPFRARQYDISVEWYATDTDYISGAVFYKDIESFIIRSTQSRVIYRPDLDQDVIYDISLPSNGEGGKVKGFEIGFTKTFGFLGEKFSGLGLSGSYTYADSETSNQNIVTGEPLPLEDLSKKSYNIVSFYEYGKFSARLAYNWRSEFLDKTQGFNQQPEIERDRSQIDFSASYKLTKKVKLSFNAINLGDDANDEYQLLEERDFKKSSVGRRYTVNISARL